MSRPRYGLLLRRKIYPAIRGGGPNAAGLASGEMVRANASENTDLFWALKGGGGNFGVVTSITYRMYPIKEVLSGLLLYPLSAAREVLRFYRDFTSGAIPTS